MPYEYIDIHTHHRSDNALCVISYGLGRDNIPSDPERPFSAGIHPWDSAKSTEANLQNHLDYLRIAPVSAIGEIGLDYHNKIDHDTQIAIFTAQLDIAAARKLPVIIHCVKAWNDLLPIIIRHPDTDFVLHGYTGSPELTARILDTGACFSLGERSLGSEKTIRSLALIPTDRIFAETDESPTPIDNIYHRLSKRLDMDITTLKEQIEANYKTIFKR